ncbi:hypothetical protein L1887_16533 [Cichorium endivia]|nr:hypothetical protein L1887_16533 [Cichorium endivia]
MLKPGTGDNTNKNKMESKKLQSPGQLSRSPFLLSLTHTRESEISTSTTTIYPYVCGSMNLSCNSLWF